MKRIFFNKESLILRSFLNYSGYVPSYKCFSSVKSKNTVSKYLYTTNDNLPVINIDHLETPSIRDAFEDYNLTYGSHDDYEIHHKIGSGKYSQVYDGINLVNDTTVVIKILKPVKKKKIRREVAVLTLLKNHENIVKLVDVIIDPSSRTPSFVFEYIKNVDFRILFPKLTSIEIKYYLSCILKGLEYSHSLKIMHRDIKPHNIIICPKTKVLKIIDWGLAEVYSENVQYSVRVASRYFKSPELLLEYQKYDYSLDIWSLGCLFAGLIFKIEPFFHGNDNFDQLIKIVKVMGSEDVTNFLNRYNIPLPAQYNNGVLNNFPKKEWSKFITPENERLCSSDAIDLLSKMLVFDHKERITAKNALNHPYFKDVALVTQT